MPELDQLRAFVDEGRWDHAVALLESAWPALYVDNTDADLAYELGRLPRRYVDQNAFLGQQLCLVTQSGPAPFEPDTSADDIHRLRGLAIAMTVARRATDFGLARELLTKGDVIAPRITSHRGEGVDPVPWWELAAGLTEYVVYDRAAAHLRWQAAYDLADRDVTGFVRPAAAARLSLMFSMIGDIHQADLWRERAVVAADPSTLAGRRALAPAVISAMVDSCERLDRAGAEQALQDLPSPLDPREDCWPQFLIAHCLYGTVFGDARTALELLEEMKKRRMVGFGPQTMTFQVMSATEAGLCLTLGFANRADAVLNAAGNGPHLNLFRARLMFLTDDLVGARDLARKSLDNPNATMGERSGLHILLMATEHRLGDRARAVLHGREAAAIASRQGALKAFNTIDRAIIDDLAAEVPFLGVVGEALDSAHQYTAYPRTLQLIRLSEREAVVLRQIATGKSESAIAKDLVVSENTVRSQRKSLYRKLGVANRGDALARAQTLGLLDAADNLAVSLVTHKNPSTPEAPD